MLCAAREPGGQTVLTEEVHYSLSFCTVEATLRQFQCPSRSLVSVAHLFNQSRITDTTGVGLLSYRQNVNAV